MKQLMQSAAPVRSRSHPEAGATSAASVRRVIAMTLVGGTCWAFSACGTEVSTPTKDVGSTQSRPATAPTQPAKTTTPRKDFRDELGTAELRRTKAVVRVGPKNPMDFGHPGW